MSDSLKDVYMLGNACYYIARLISYGQRTKSTHLANLIFICTEYEVDIATRITILKIR